MSCKNADGAWDLGTILHYQGSQNYLSTGLEGCRGEQAVLDVVNAPAPDEDGGGDAWALVQRVLAKRRGLLLAATLQNRQVCCWACLCLFWGCVQGWSDRHM